MLLVPCVDDLRRREEVSGMGKPACVIQYIMIINICVKCQLITKDKYPIIDDMITRSCQDHAYYEYTEIGGRGIEYKYECTQNVNKVKKQKL